MLQFGRARAILRMEPVFLGGRAMEQQTFFEQDAAAPFSNRRNAFKCSSRHPPMPSGPRPGSRS